MQLNLLKHKVIIICGGKGKRLENITKQTPKPLVKVGKFSIIEHKLNYYKKQGLEDFVFCIGYKGNILKKFLKLIYKNKSTFGNDKSIFYDFKKACSNKINTEQMLSDAIYDNEKFYDSNDNGKFDTFNPPTKPGGNHIFGTDNRGRDVFARLIYGFQISITFALIVTFFAYSLGILIGGTMGYFGGKVDLFGVRIIEIFMAIPFLFLMMIIASLMRPNVVVLALILVFLTGWIGISFFIRGEFYREKAKDYVSAAISMGQSNIKIMFKHILPNALTPIITYAPFAIIGYISTLVILDFLGFGLQPPTPSWGELISQARENLSAWHLIVTPLSAMAITLFLITFIGEAVREAFDPKTYSRLR